MKGGYYAKGFTIVETLIVLSVSGFMLVAVAGIISSKQGQSEFQQSINSITQKLQQAIDDVNYGYYPVNGVKCDTSSTGPSITSSSGSLLGTNGACVLVGKVIQFDATDKSNEQFVDYPLVDLAAGGRNYTAIAPGININTSVPDNSTQTKLNGGLTVYYSAPSTVDVSGSSPPTFGFGLIMSGQGINLYYIKNTSASNTTKVNVDYIDTPVYFVALTSSFNICLASGTTNQSGLISIGGSNGKNLSVTVTIKDGTKC